MKMTLMMFCIFAVLTASAPCSAIQPGYRPQPPKPSKLARIRSAVLKFERGDFRALLPHKNAQQRTITLKGLDPKLVIVDSWGGKPNVVFEDGNPIQANHLSRGAMFGLKVAGGIAAGIAAILGALGGVMD